MILIYNLFNNSSVSCDSPKVFLLYNLVQSENIKIKCLDDSPRILNSLLCIHSGLKVTINFLSLLPLRNEVWEWSKKKLHFVTPSLHLKSSRFCIGTLKTLSPGNQLPCYEKASLHQRTCGGELSHSYC